jgi:signal peptidase
MAAERKPLEKPAATLRMVTPEEPVAPQNQNTGRVEAVNALARPAALRRGVRLLSYAVLGALISVAGLVAAATLPVLFGYHSFIIYGGSMAPALRAGDVALTKPVAAEDVRVGDIIATRSNSQASPVLHRVTAIEEEDGQRQFIIKGDRNDSADPEPVFLLGSGDRVVHRVPLAGYLIHFVRTLPGRLLFLILPSLLLGGMILWEIWRPRRAAETLAPLSASEGPAPQAGPMALPTPTLEVVMPEPPGAGAKVPSRASSSAPSRRAALGVAKRARKRRAAGSSARKRPWSRRKTSRTRSDGQRRAAA